VGQMCALSEALEAAQTYKVSVCGLQSQDLYEPTPYSEFFKSNKPVIEVPSGFGIGFEDLLQKENWVEL